MTREAETAFKAWFWGQPRDFQEATPGFILKLAFLAGHAAADTDAKAEGSIDWQQRQGRHADIIRQALNAYDEWMKEDDFDAQGCLDMIIARMRDRFTASDLPSEADTDATRKLARMVELAGVLEAEPRAQVSLLYADYAKEIAARILAIVEDNQSNSAVTPAAAEYSTPQAPAHSEIEPDGRPEEER